MKIKIQRFNLDEGRIWEAIEGLSPFKTTYTLEEVCEKLNELSEENEQLKIANVRWLDKSLQDKQIRYDNLTCNELTKKYLQLKEENEQLRKEHQEMLEKYLLLKLKMGEVLNDE